MKSKMQVDIIVTWYMRASSRNHSMAALYIPLSVRHSYRFAVINLLLPMFWFVTLVKSFIIMLEVSDHHS